MKREDEGYVLNGHTSLVANWVHVSHAWAIGEGATSVFKHFKVFGLGCAGYWADGWNRMDFLIVTCGIIDFLPGVESGALSALRTTRVLRPLRVVNRFPSTFFFLRFFLRGGFWSLLLFFFSSKLSLVFYLSLVRLYRCQFFSF